MANFEQFRTFVDRGIEYMKFKNRPYRVYRTPSQDKKQETKSIFLLPIISVDDELAKDKHYRNKNINENR